MPSNLLAAFGSGMEGFSKTLLGGVMLKAQFEREKLQYQREIETLKVKSNLQRQLMLDEQGQIRAREESIAGINYQKAVELENMKSQRAVELAELQEKKALKLEQEKSKLQTEREEKAREDNWNRVQPFLKLWGINPNAVNPGIVTGVMQGLDEKAGIPPEYHGQGFGLGLAMAANLSKVKEAFQGIQQESVGPFGRPTSETKSTLKVTDKGPQLGFETTTKPELTPTTTEGWGATMARWALEQGYFGSPNETESINKANQWYREFTTSPLDQAKLNAIDKLNKGKGTAGDLAALGITIPGIKGGETEAVKGAEAAITTKQQAHDWITAERDKIDKRYESAIKEAAQQEGGEGLVEKYQELRRAEYRERLFDYWQANLSQFGSFPFPDLLKAAPAPTGRLKDIKDLKKLIRE